jgi:hypothetical protein
MLKEDENNEKTKKNKNARGDDENANNRLRPRNVALLVAPSSNQNPSAPLVVNSC